jgi:hypothetical protein
MYTYTWRGIPYDLLDNFHGRLHQRGDVGSSSELWLSMAITRNVGVTNMDMWMMILLL